MKKIGLFLLLAILATPAIGWSRTHYGSHRYSSHYGGHYYRHHGPTRHYYGHHHRRHHGGAWVAPLTYGLLGAALAVPYLVPDSPRTVYVPQPVYVAPPVGNVIPQCPRGMVPYETQRQINGVWYGTGQYNCGPYQ